MKTVESRIAFSRFIFEDAEQCALQGAFGLGVNYGHEDEEEEEDGDDHGGDGHGVDVHCWEKALKLLGPMLTGNVPLCCGPL